MLQDFKIQQLTVSPVGEAIDKSDVSRTIDYVSEFSSFIM